jgi:hypothetical protein
MQRACDFFRENGIEHLSLFRLFFKAHFILRRLNKGG